LMNETHTKLYRVMRRLIGLALGFYFRRIERFHAERVPATGPVLFVSNHPNSVTDSFIIGASVPRKVNFVATVQLFRLPAVKWLLTQCGVIPINRIKDDPRAMRTVADTFAACHRVLERGEAVGIFPEGITYDDSRLKEIKSGAARMALELEHRHGGKLGLQVAPVGLTYSAKELYRSDVLAHFGEPIRAADYIEGYGERRKECITRLTEEIGRRLQSLILHIPQLEHERVVAGVKRLHFDRLLMGSGIVHEPISPRAQELLLTQQIAEAVAHVYRVRPGQACAWAAKLDFYERQLKRLNISDEALALFSGRQKLFWRSFGWAFIAILGAPIALYGWAHRLVPFAMVKWMIRRFAEPGRQKVQVSTTAIAGGLVVFGICYGFLTLMCHRWFGWPFSLWYALSLPVSGMIAHYYLRELRKLAAGVRNAVVLMRAPAAARRLLGLRAELVGEVDAVRAELRRPEGRVEV